MRYVTLAKVDQILKGILSLTIFMSQPLCVFRFSI